MPAMTSRQQTQAGACRIFFIAGLAEGGRPSRGAHALARCSRAITKSALRLVPAWMRLIAGLLLECIGTC